MCHDIITKKLYTSFDGVLCSNISVFAVEHQLDSLLSTCLNIIENSIEEIADNSWFDTLPLSVLTMLVKSPYLEVRELDLFL